MQQAKWAIEQKHRDEARKVLAFAEAYREDEALRSRSETDPHAALAEHGIDMPSDVDLHIVANTADELHLVMPPTPNRDLADEDLTAVVGGASGKGAGAAQEAYEAGFIAGVAEAVGRLTGQEVTL